MKFCKNVLKLSRAFEGVLGWLWGGPGLMDGEDGSQLDLAPICFATIRQLSKKSKVRKTSLSCFCTYFKEYFLKKKTKSIFVVLQPRVILASLVLYICFLSLSSMQVSLRTVSIIVTYKWTWGWKYWYTNVSSNWCWLWCTAADATYCWWCWCSNADAVAANTNLCWCFLCCRLFKACRGRGRDLGEAKAG